MSETMTTRFSAADVAIVIPTRERWDILSRTLESLAGQTSTGFEVVVVVDGKDQHVPTLPRPEGLKVLEKEHGGPGAARNAGARATSKDIVLFLGDDMIASADLVARHVDQHNRHPGCETAVLGFAQWHEEASRGGIQKWIDRSGTQFDFGSIAAEEAGFGHFYSCNVSLKREFFLDGGGFDESFIYYYEDLDCGWRLAQKGMRLVYEPNARSAHLHRYDLTSLERRFEGVAAGEHMMAERHAWFEPHFLPRILGAAGCQPPNPMWPRLVDHVPTWASQLRQKAFRRSDLWYYQRLAGPFSAGWAAAADLAELQRYLGDAYDRSRLVGHQQGVDDERDSAPDEQAFYRTSNEYLYDLTVFAMSGTKAPYLAEIKALVPQGGRLLDYGCGIGADGLRLAADGYDVSYADFANPSTKYLRWRLDRRGLDSRIYDLDRDSIPDGFHAVYCFDVIEHVDQPFDFLGRLESHGDLVAVNFLEEDPHDTDLHRPLPIDRLLDHAAASGLLRYRLYHGRSHFVVYRSPKARRDLPRGVRPSRIRSVVQRRLGDRLPGRDPWYPVPVH